MRVLFVDDEPNILSGLRRILHAQRKEWDMVFKDGGEPGLEALAESPCDVIVSDMKMPGMNGAEFLSKVREKYPGSIRIALSGETDSYMIYRCVQHAHQYLAKPCDADELVAAVRRAFSLRDLMQDKDLEAMVAEMTSLPSRPEQYDQIMRELQSEDPSLQKVGQIIETDVAMSAKILQLVNSAFFGLARHLSSPSEAAMYLGVDVLRSLVLTTGVFSQFEDDNVDVATLKSVWDHSTQVGALAKQIARSQTGDDLLADYALMGGLLANVGKLIFATNFAEKFAQLQTVMATEAISDIQAEEQLFGHSHMDVGAYLVGLWGLPNPVVECVAYHHTPNVCVDSGFAPVSAVHIANAIVISDGGEPMAELDPDYVAAIGVVDKLAGWVEMHLESQGAGS